MYGWVGTVLEVDLSSGQTTKRPLEKALRANYIGGRGINSRILYEEVKPGTDPFGPENRLIFGTGPLGGTLAPCPNRMSVTAKAFYHGLGTSNVGGSFAPELKWAGYDHIVFRGKAEKPVYLWIYDDQVEVRPATHLWGRTTWEAEKMIQAELGSSKIRVASIGPGGENRVVFASITFTRYRSAAQTGMGAIMGSKNLKAVAVQGSKTVRVARPEALKKLTRELTQRIRQNQTYPMMNLHGTTAYIDIFNERYCLGIRNYQKGGSWQGIEALQPDAFSPHYIKSKSCMGCPIQCSHFFVIQDGPYAGERGGGIEGGHTIPLGPVLDNTHTTSHFKCRNLCEQYSLDIMELSYTLAAAMEWYEKGILTPKDTEGIALEWGNHEAIVQMIHKIGRREGLGDLLAQGAVQAARTLGKEAERAVSHCKMMTMGLDDTRVSKGIALSHATGIIPCHHEEGMPPLELLPRDLGEVEALWGSKEVADPLSYNKAGITAYFHKLCTAVDALEVCKFATDWFAQELGYRECAALFSAATGVELSPEDLEEAGERINNLERAFWVREGFTREDDHLQGRVVDEPVAEGPYQGERIDPQKFERMLDDYYRVRGWEVETGIPTRERLERLGLKDVADELGLIG